MSLATPILYLNTSTLQTGDTSPFIVSLTDATPSQPWSRVSGSSGPLSVILATVDAGNATRATLATGNTLHFIAKADPADADLAVEIDFTVSGDEGEEVYTASTAQLAVDTDLWDGKTLLNLFGDFEERDSGGDVVRSWRATLALTRGVGDGGSPSPQIYVKVIPQDLDSGQKAQAIENLGLDVSTTSSGATFGTTGICKTYLGNTATTGFTQEWIDSSNAIVASVRDDGQFITVGAKIGPVGDPYTAIGNAAAAGFIQSWNDALDVTLARFTNLGILEFSEDNFSGFTAQIGDATYPAVWNNGGAYISYDNSAHFAGDWISLNADGGAKFATGDLTISSTGVLTLGVAGTRVGTIEFKNATSGTITLQPVTGALGAVVLSLPATTGTLATLAGAETLSNKTLVAPILGTPTSGTLTNCTGLPVAGGGTGAANAALARVNLGVSRVTHISGGDASWVTATISGAVASNTYNQGSRLIQIASSTAGFGRAVFSNSNACNLLSGTRTQVDYSRSFRAVLRMVVGISLDATSAVTFMMAAPATPTAHDLAEKGLALQFYGNGSSAALVRVQAHNGSSATSSSTSAWTVGSDTFYDFELVWLTGVGLYLYVDGVLTCSLTTGLPSGLGTAASTAPAMLVQNPVSGTSGAVARLISLAYASIY